MSKFIIVGKLRAGELTASITAQVSPTSFNIPGRVVDVTVGLIDSALPVALRVRKAVE